MDKMHALWWEHEKQRQTDTNPQTGNVNAGSKLASWAFKPRHVSE